jgi:hypothetical protein
MREGVFKELLGEDVDSVRKLEVGVEFGIRVGQLIAMFFVLVLSFLEGLANTNVIHGHGI